MKADELTFPVYRIMDMRIVINPPSHVGRNIRHEYGSEEYWKTLEKEYERWLKEFDAFVRDHRSQDGNRLMLSIEKTTQECCAACGDRWDINEDERGAFCASCGAKVKRVVTHLAPESGE